MKIEEISDSLSETYGDRVGTYDWWRQQPNPMTMVWVLKEVKLENTSLYVEYSSWCWLKGFESWDLKGIEGLLRVERDVDVIWEGELMHLV